jgi:hypothetical protein
VTSLRTSDYQCGRCARTFGSLALFDRHQQVSYKSVSPVSCMEPEALGMVLDTRSVWQTPEGLRVRTQRAARMDKVMRARRN